MHDNGRNGLGRDRSSGVEKLLSRDVWRLVVIRRFFVVPLGMVTCPPTVCRPGSHRQVFLLKT